VKINTGFTLLKKNFFMVNNPQKMFTIFTAAFLCGFVQTNLLKNGHFLRIGIAKVKESEHDVL
jgi:hypothetical protein